ncbi:MAG: class I SAM-dependent methyltransferase [Patescibacteria group bacterium]
MSEKHQDIKDTYNTLVGEKLDGAYEHDRWFKTPVLALGYEMTKYAVNRHVLSNISKDTESVLELGPGPGTWTKELLTKAPNAHYDLVDISREMLAAAAKALDEHKENINYNEIDFLDFEVVKKYDVFFSSRAVEYIRDKGAVVAKIVQALKSGGRGFIITKTPHYDRQKMLGKSVPDMHKNQISPDDLKQLLQNHGCIEVKVYPVSMSFFYSVFRSLGLNKLLHVLFRNTQLNSATKHFAESYLITFKKQ